MPGEAELRLRDRLARLKSLPLLSGARLSGELERLDAYGMAATVEFDAAAKQQLLELRSESARLRLLAVLLQGALERLEVLERAQARALSNGKVRFA